MSLQSDMVVFRAEHAGVLHVTERFYREPAFCRAIAYGASAAGPYGKIDPQQRRVGVERLEIRGLGHLWSYDTALRIAFNRGPAFYPQFVFLKRGILRGIRKILTKTPAGGRTLPLDIFPS